MRKTQNPRNILYLVLSIVIAAGIWYYVDEFNGRVVTQTVTGIPIEYINQDALAEARTAVPAPPSTSPLRETGGTLFNWIVPRSG